MPNHASDVKELIIAYPIQTLFVQTGLSVFVFFSFFLGGGGERQKANVDACNILINAYSIQTLLQTGKSVFVFFSGGRGKKLMLMLALLN